ncbi:MAG TPA: PaaI family thioesterase [Usitatibacter sp.]|nr:PaaI family thioesterase [Usitatibacter sp.]
MPTPFIPADPQFEARTRASFARQGIMSHLGAVLESVEPGRVTIALPFRAELSQQHGFFHAGVISTIADSAGGYAGFTLFPPDAAVLTVEFKVNLIAPADGERALAVGEVMRSGRTVTVCRLDAWVEKAGRRAHCATGLQTLMCLVGRGLRD